MPFCPSCSSYVSEPCERFKKVGTSLGIAFTAPALLFGPLTGIFAMATAVVIGENTGEALDKKFPRYRCPTCKRTWTEKW